MRVLVCSSAVRISMAPLLMGGYFCENYLVTVLGCNM